MGYESLRDRRYRNFRQLIGEGRGAVARAAKRLGKSAAQVSNFGGENPTKGIGESLAREIDTCWNKPAGWLDAEHHDEKHTPGADLHTTLTPQSQSVRLDPAILAEAEKWVLFEEGALGAPYQLLRHMERLAAVYERIWADGGRLTPAHADELITAARKGVDRGTSEKERGRGAGAGGVPAAAQPRRSATKR